MACTNDSHGRGGMRGPYVGCRGQWDVEARLIHKQLMYHTTTHNHTTLHTTTERERAQRLGGDTRSTRQSTQSTPIKQTEGSLQLL